MRYVIVMVLLQALNLRLKKCEFEKFMENARPPEVRAYAAHVLMDMRMRACAYAYVFVDVCV